ncbi:MAG: VOC family protein [Acidimicrobiia bacterium]
MAVHPIPEGYPRVIPYLAIDGAGKALDWYTSVLGATERVRMEGPGGTVGHAEIEIGDAVIMLADEFEDIGHLSPKKLGGTPVSICLYVESVDAVFAKAIKEGATEIQPVEDKFYGDRSGSFKDPFGHSWNIMTHVEDVPPDEMEKRAAKAMEEMSG